MSQLEDIGEICVCCGDSVAEGSGKYVNRIPADDGQRSGFLCADCQMISCERCGHLELEHNTIELGDGEVEFVCDDCLTSEDLELL